MTIQQYETRLRAKGYRVKENLTFLETPYGLCYPLLLKIGRDLEVA